MPWVSVPDIATETRKSRDRKQKIMDKLEDSKNRSTRKIWTFKKYPTRSQKGKLGPNKNNLSNWNLKNAGILTISVSLKKWKGHIDQRKTGLEEVCL